MFQGSFEWPDVWRPSLRTLLFKWLKMKLDVYSGKRYLFPGLMSALAFAYRCLKPKGVVLTSVSEGEIKIYLDGKDDVMSPEILAYGHHEQAATFVFKQHLKPGMTVLDVGANIGYYSLIASKQVGSEGKVYAFEPNPGNYSILCRNIEINGCRNVTPIPKALSNHKGAIDLFCDSSNFGAHTFASKNIPGKLSGSVRVETLELDDFVKEIISGRVDFIKMDVQGAEGLVLEKAEKTLNAPGLKILMEFWPEGLRNLNTDPNDLLRRIARDFDISVVEEPNKVFTAKTDVILKICEKRSYVDLFCVRKGAL